METRSSSSSSNQLAFLVMVILLALPYCYASKGVEKDGVGVQGREHMDKAKVDLSNLPLSVEITRVILQGRKLMSEGNTGMRNNDGIKTEESKKQSAGVEAASSKNISGKKKSSDTAPHAYQNDAVKKSEKGSFQTLETDKVVDVEAAVSLVNTDYEGDGGPGDRSPINNHEPLH